MTLTATGTTRGGSGDSKDTPVLPADARIPDSAAATDLPRRASGPFLAPLALGSAAALLYIATRQRALYGDGIFFEGMLGRGQLVYNHVLYLPAVTLLRAALAPLVSIGAEASMKLLSALTGGIGVALTYLLGVRVLGDRKPACAAAALLAVLPGYWFFATATEVHALHGACAALLLLALTRAVGTPTAAPEVRAGPVFLGSLLTPASHLSGAIAILPVLYAWRRAANDRRTLILAAGAGFALFAGLYVALSVMRSGFHGYTQAFGAVYALFLSYPLRPLVVSLNGARELLLFAVPASPLVPAGLFVLSRRSPALARLFLIWILAWPLIAIPIGDRAYGSYYVPTFCSQAIVAVAAFRQLTRSRALLMVGCLLALLPGLGSIYGYGLTAYALSAVVLLLLCRLDAGPQVRGMSVLPIAALAFSLVMYVPLLSQDPLRDRIDAVAKFSGGRGLVLLIEAGGSHQHFQWMRFFPRGPRAIVNLAVFDLLPPEQLAPQVERLRGRVHAAIAAGRPVYVAWSLGPHWRGPQSSAFLDWVRDTYQLRTPAGAPPDMQQVVKRR